LPVQKSPLEVQANFPGEYFVAKKTPGSMSHGDECSTDDQNKAVRKRAEFHVDTLEPRILLSGTWVEVADAEVIITEEEFTDDAPGETDVYWGTDASDTLTGTSGDDFLVGLHGNDVLNGGDGHDTFVYREGDGTDRYAGGDGKDVIDATAAKTLQLNVFQSKNSIETIAGSEEGLSIQGTNAKDVLDFSGTTLKNVSHIDAGAGNDTVTGSHGDDIIVGGKGNDVLNGGNGHDTFVYREGDGTDRYAGDDGKDVIDATAAKTLQLNVFQSKNSIETIAGSDEGLSIQGTNAKDVLDFSRTTLKNVSHIDAGAGNDTVTGSHGDDIIVGGKGNDVLNGGNGHDTFVYREGDGTDRYAGGDGKDVIDATAAKTLQLNVFQSKNSIETIAGSEVGLSIQGTNAKDVLDFSRTTLKNVSHIDAGAGNDTVTGSRGDDIIVGGAGNDILNGGKGNDLLELSGNRSDYLVTEQPDGSLYISDSRGTDGNDRVSGFERFQFADQTLDYNALLNDAPTAIKLDGGSVSEAAAGGTVVGKLYTADADKSDAHTYQIVDAKGNAIDDANFVIKDNAIVVRDGASLDFESAASQILHVQVTDKAGATHIEAISININDANDAPTAIKIDGGSVSEAAAGGTVVGKLYTADADKGDAYTYQLVDAKGNAIDDANFVIKDNAIVVRDGASLDFESAASQTLQVQVTDKAGATHIEAISININDANDAPTAIKIDGGSVSEAAAGGTVVGKLYTADADNGDAHTYQIVDAQGNAVDDANFVIQDNAIVVRDGASLDFESSASQTLHVQVTDKAGATHIEAISININDANDAPTAIKIDGGSVSEAAAGGTVVGKLYTADADKGDAYTYQLVDAKGNAIDDANFVIKDNAIVVRDGASLDFESNASQTLHVQVTDKAGATHIEAISININDANDAPTAIKIDGGSVSEAAAGGTVVGKLYTADADNGDAHTYQIVDAKGNAIDDANFVIQDNAIVVREDASLDFESNASQTLHVQVTDRAGVTHIQDITISIEDANDAPTAIKIDGGSVSEAAASGTVVGKLYTADADKGDAHTYQLVDAQGNAVKDTNFEIQDNAIVVRDGASLDFESAASQILHVQVTDKAGATHIEDIVISIEDANDAPTAIKLDGGVVSEAAAGGTVVGKLYTADADKGDAHTYQLVDAQGNAVKDTNFEIQDNALVVRDGASLDFESNASQTLYVQVTDTGGATHIEDIIISIEDANDAPTGIKLDGGSVSEAAAGGTVVGKLYTADADKGDAHSYQIVDAIGNVIDDANFEIQENAIVVRDGASLDFESAASQILHVEVTDKAGASHIEAVTINVTDANDAPTAIKLDGGSVSEAAAGGTVVGKLYTADADKSDAHTYQIVDAKGNVIDDANFVIKNNTLVVRDGASLDFESSASQTLHVEVTDKAGATHFEAVTINVTDANDAPTAIKLDGGVVSEAAAGGTVVGKLYTADADKGDAHTYQLVDAKGNVIDDANFVIQDNAIVVRDGASLDFESAASQTLHVQVTDQAGATHIEDIAISIEDANDAPTAIKIDGGSVSEAAASGTVVGKLYTADADKGDAHSYQIVDAIGNVIDDANFVIQDNAIVVRDGASLDFESNASQTLHVQVTDQAGATHIQDIAISIEDANDAPTAIKIDGGSVSEAAASGTVVGKLYTADADKGDAHTYQLVDAQGNAVKDTNFEIQDNAIVVRDGASLDFESAASQILHVQVTDKAGATHIEDIVISIEDANDAPTAIKLDGGVVSEAAAGGTVVGKLYTADADKGDAHTYQLVDAQGNAVKDTNFEIQDNALVVRDGASLDFESNASQTLYVQVTDTGGATHIEDIIISIEDANDAPTGIKLDGGSVSEAAAGGTVVGKLYTADADKGDAHSYQIVDAIGNVIDDANFVIQDNAIVVRDGASLDFESAASQTLHVQVTDKAGATHIEAISININDANDSPTAIKIDGGSVSEAAAGGTVVGKLYTADADKGDAHTYQLVDAKGNLIDDANFVIEDNAIVVRDGTSLDFESNASQTLHVQVTDRAGAAHIEAISINISDTNDSPTAIKIDSGSVSEAAAGGTVVGKLQTADADKGDAHTYQLVDAKGIVIDDANFVIQDNAVVVRDGASLDFESNASQTLHVQVTDRAGVTHIQDIAISIEDANDAPTAIKIDGGSVSEAAAGGTVVGKLYTADADKGDAHTYQIVDAKGNAIDDANFVIKDNALVVRDGASLDFESSALQTLHVEVTDKAGATHIEAVTINVTDANDAPTAIKLDGGSVSEAAAGGTVVGKLYTADADKSDAHTYQIVDAKGNVIDDANFVIKNNTLVVRDGASLDFESSALQTLHVEVTDKAGATHIEAVTINVNDANDAPTAIKLDGGVVSEAAAGGTVVGKLHTADADKGDSHTYQLVDAKGNLIDDANFVIQDNAIVVRDGASLDFESAASQTLHVQVTDQAGATHIEDIAISIEDANDAPTAIKIDGGVVSEAAAGGTVVGKLYTADADKGDAHTYQLVDAKGNLIDDANFVIQDNAIVVRDGASLDFESNASQTLHVQVTDTAGATHIEDITINITDANDAPTAIEDQLATHEDEPIVVRFRGAEMDAADQVEQIRIDALPLHGQLMLNDRALAVGDEISASDADNGRLVFVPDKNWHGDTQLSFSVFDGEQWSERSAIVSLHVEAVADGASLITEPVRGLAGESVLLQISALKQNQDGSEQLAVLISGLPNGASLNAGIRQGDGSWLLDSENLSSLMLVLPPGQSQEFNLFVTAITTEANGSSASTSSSLHVTVDTPIAVVPAVMPATAVQVQPESERTNDEEVSESETPSKVEDLSSNTSGSDSGNAPRETFDDIKPVGDMVVLFRNKSIDWSTTEFGEIQPVATEGLQEMTTRQGESAVIVDEDEDSPPSNAVSVKVPASVSSFLWMWSAVRAMTGMRDERRGR
jgi:hypothetical protein